jgi:signal transduction histidine kinase
MGNAMSTAGALARSASPRLHTENWNGSADPLPGRPDPRGRIDVVRRTGLLAAVAIGVGITALVVAVPGLRVSSGRSTLHAEFVTASALVALLVAMLAAGRYRRRGRAGDLFLAAALTVLGASRLVTATVPALSGHAPHGVAAWLPISGRLVAAALLAAAALVAARAVRRPARMARRLAFGVVVVLAVATIIPAALGSELPARAAGGGPYDLFGGSAAAIVVKAVAAALVVLAAAGFTVHGHGRRDWFSMFLAWGTALLAFGWINYLLVPSLYVDWFYAGDVLGLAAFGLYAAGAVAEIRAYQEARTRLAAVEERSRVARELHDGVAQELVHVLVQARALERRAPGQDVARIVGAAERALEESRAAISALRAPVDEPLHAALRRAAGELGRRLGLEVHVRAQRDVDVAPPVREALLRIVGEALANAARHGGARRVQVELGVGRGEQRHLTVRDDGCGFDPHPDRIPRGAYGLVAMRERAAAFGGELAIRSAPGAGTEIEVALP